MHLLVPDAEAPGQLGKGRVSGHDSNSLTGRVKLTVVMANALLTIPCQRGCCASVVALMDLKSRT